MTIEEIVERNIKIAKFVGFTPVYPNLADCNVFRYQKLFPKFDQALYVTEVTSTGSNGRFKVKNITHWVKSDEFEFHFNMGWLMPVVEKIEQINEDLPIVYVVINGYGCEISYMINHNWPEDRDVIVDVGYPEAQSKIESVWKAVVKFIEKHNEYSSSLQS